MISQFDDFRGLAQSGQELSRESLWPAEIKFADSPAIPCSGGGQRFDPAQLGNGYRDVDFEVSFRVRKELIADRFADIVGTVIEWREFGDPAWQPRVRVDSATSPAGDQSTYLLVCKPARLQ